MATPRKKRARAAEAPSSSPSPAPTKKNGSTASPAAKKKAASSSAPAAKKQTRKAAPKRKAPATKPPLGRANAPLAPKPGDDEEERVATSASQIQVRRMHRRDINRVWEFIKLSFRDVNRETVEYQRPRSKQRFEEQYDDEGIEQLLFEADAQIVGYAECAFEVRGSDNWINPRYFESRDMSPLFVEELATHPDYQGRGVGSFMLEQLQHLARIHGCTHLVLEVAENNEAALSFYRRRSFYKLDAALFLAQKVDREPEFLPPRALKDRPVEEDLT